MLGWLLAGSAASLPAQTPAAPAPSYDSFRLVRLRNIFDPDRRGLRGDPAPVTSRTNAPLPNYIALTGAMVTEGRKLAFFSGARPEYSKVLSPRGKIADFTVQDITPTEVELRLDGKPVIVAVGQNVPLTNSSAGKLPGLQPPPEIAPPPVAAPLSAIAPPAPRRAPAPGGPPSSPDEILRRMMERRQKELAK